VKPADLALTIGVMLLWGLNFPIAKLGLAELPPILMMALRFALVALLLCPFMPLPRDKLGGILVVAVLLGGFHFSLMFTGLSRIDASAAAILTQSQVLFSTLLGIVVYRDRLSRRLVAGMLLAFLGVALVAGEPRFGSDPWPILMILGAALVWALANVAFKRIGAIHPFALSGWMAFFAAPQLCLTSWVLESGQSTAVAAADWRAWAALLYNAVVVTIISYGMWYPLVRKHPMSFLMPFTLLVPVVGVLSSVLILGDRVTWQMAAGGLATIAGIAIIALRAPAPRPR
jgi:O-acetylserine/cysteine efflux transporter